MHRDAGRREKLTQLWVAFDRRLARAITLALTRVSA